MESYDADAANETIEADADATAYATGMSEAGIKLVKSLKWHKLWKLLLLQLEKNWSWEAFQWRWTLQLLKKQLVWKQESTVFDADAT